MTWISVEDEMPEDGEPVIIWFLEGGAGGCFIAAYHLGNNWYDEQNYTFSDSVTHWMRITSPFKEAN